MAIDNGLSNHYQELAEAGYDATEVLEGAARIKGFAKKDLQLAIAKALDLDPEPAAPAEPGADA